MFVCVCVGMCRACLKCSPPRCLTCARCACWRSTSWTHGSCRTHSSTGTRCRSSPTSCASARSAKGKKPPQQQMIMMANRWTLAWLTRHFHFVHFVRSLDTLTLTSVVSLTLEDFWKILKTVWRRAWLFPTSVTSSTTTLNTISLPTSTMSATRSIRRRPTPPSCEYHQCREICCLVLGFCWQNMQSSLQKICLW